MSNGGSQVTAATPWGPASPYLTDIMAQAKTLFGQQVPNYANPSANFGYGQATGAVGNALDMTSPYGSMATSLAPNTTTAIQKQLSGVPDYTAVKQSLDAANQQTWDSFNNQELPQLNQRASFLGNPSGSIKDLNWATANIGRNMDLNAQQQYLGEYDRAQAAQANAAGLGANIAQGAGSQSLQGASLYPGIAQMPNQSLADYANIVSGTGGKFGTSTESAKAGSAGTAANIIGGLTAGAGLLNSVFGTGGTTGASLASKAGSLFSGSGAIDTAGLGSMAGNAASTAGTSAIGSGLADTAGDVAASNSAWLAGSGTGAELGASAVAEPALASIGTGAIDTAATSAASSAAAATGGGTASAGGALGGGASADGATTAGLGAGAGAAAAVALPLAALAAGYFQPGVKMPASYYASMLKGLNANPGTPEYNQASQEVIAQIASGEQDRRGIALPQAIQDKAKQLGLFDAAKAMNQAAQYMQAHPGYAPARGKTSGVNLNKY